MSDADDMLSVDEVARFFGGITGQLDRSTVYRWVRDGRIPAPVRVGPKLSRWRRSECREALDAMIAASKPKEGV